LEKKALAIFSIFVALVRSADSIGVHHRGGRLAARFLDAVGITKIELAGTVICALTFTCWNTAAQGALVQGALPFFSLFCFACLLAGHTCARVLPGPREAGRDFPTTFLLGFLALNSALYLLAWISPSSIIANALVLLAVVVAYPEGWMPPNYQLFRPYLHSKELRWSFGASRGTKTDSWQRNVAKNPLPELTSELSRAGFTGLHIDIDGYTENAPAFRADPDRVLGPPDVTGKGDCWRFSRIPRPERSAD
jgi:hypothetical protein